jgi:hypothetical protein
MSDTLDVAYCGLHCGDCVIRTGRLAALAQALRHQMRKPEFMKLAEGLPEIKPEIFNGLREAERCLQVLDSMTHLDCERVCHSGGGGQACAIRKCGQERGFDGCWECDDFEHCETLASIDPVHKGAHRKNIRMIRQKGIDGFLAGHKYW